VISSPATEDTRDQDLLATVRQAMTEALGHAPELELLPEVTFADLGMDSLAQLELITLLENELELIAPPTATDHVQTVGQLMAVLRALIDGTALPSPTEPEDTDTTVEASTDTLDVDASSARDARAAL
jgi:acyl carrier protein